MICPRYINWLDRQIQTPNFISLGCRCGHCGIRKTIARKPAGAAKSNI